MDEEARISSTAGWSVSSDFDTALDIVGLGTSSAIDGSGTSWSWGISWSICENLLLTSGSAPKTTSGTIVLDDMVCRIGSAPPI